jgi:hypothetical protein
MRTLAADDARAICCGNLTIQGDKLKNATFCPKKLDANRYRLLIWDIRHSGHRMVAPIFICFSSSEADYLLNETSGGEQSTFQSSVHASEYFQTAAQLPDASNVLP